MISSVLLGARWETITDDSCSLDVLHIFMGGFVWMALGLGLLTYSTRLTATPFVVLVILLKTVVAPVWVYTFLDEEPSSIFV